MISPPPFFVLHFPAGSAIMYPRRGYSSSVERQLPKLHRWVRLPLAAPASEQSSLCSDIFFFLRNKRTASACFLAHSFRTGPAVAGLRFGSAASRRFFCPGVPDAVRFSGRRPVGPFSTKAARPGVPLLLSASAEGTPGQPGGCSKGKDLLIADAQNPADQNDLVRV